VLTTGRLIDREMTSNYSLTVLACRTDDTADTADTDDTAAAAADDDDDGDDVYSCAANVSLSLLVNVHDVNDNPPQFDRYVEYY